MSKSKRREFESQANISTFLHSDNIPIMQARLASLRIRRRVIEEEEAHLLDLQMYLRTNPPRDTISESHPISVPPR